MSTRKVKIIATTAVVLSAAIVLLASPPAVVLGITSEVETRGLPPRIYAYSGLPSEVTYDASQLAEELFGKNEEVKNEFVSRLLYMYLAARDKDLVILFNPGGWGWRFLDDSPNWLSIFMGIQEEMKDAGYRCLLLEHRRSVNTLKSYLDEYMAVIGLYPLKAQTLASRLEFLTSHIPGLKIIVTGESNGTIICDQAMEILKDNPRIYSIQTGTPFWRRSTKTERVLVINDNGKLPDSFSNGDLFAIVSGSLESFLGLAPPQENLGTVFVSLAAPGHVYSWQNPIVRGQIEEFLRKNLPVRHPSDS